MDSDQEKQALQAKLDACRKLASEYTDGVTARNLVELASELEQKLRQIDANHA
jgi:hypothetical protein